MKIREFIAKLQNLPEKQKKTILWGIVAVLAIILGLFWISRVINLFNSL